VWRPALVALVALCAAGNAGAQQKETISFEGRQKGKPVQVTATIYWPSTPGPVPALVIHHGSGSVSDRREGRFAREMVAMGVAAVVIDSFGPRGVTSTVTDQSAVTGQDFNLDAYNVLKALGSNGRACITCHQPSNAMSVSAAALRQRWTETGGRDPVFAAVDGSNCPSLPQAAMASHSLTINRGLFRIAMAWPPPSLQPDFTIEVVKDPTGCNTDSEYGLNGASHELANRVSIGTRFGNRMRESVCACWRLLRLRCMDLFSCMKESSERFTMTKS